MKTRSKTVFKNERGVALVTTLMLSLLLSILVGGMLIASTSDTLIGSNDVRSNQAFYVAEAGINRAAGWFSSRFGSTPSAGYVLPEKYFDADWKGSNTVGVAGKLSFTTGEKNFAGETEESPYYKPGAVSDSTEQALPTSVKTLVDGKLQNVVLAGDSTNTFPTNYSVVGLNDANVETTYTYADLVSTFTSELADQKVGDGTFSVKAILVSVLPETASGSGMITWLVKSEGKLTRGNSTVASATVWAYMSTSLDKVLGSRLVDYEDQVVNVDPGVVARGMVDVKANSIQIDSYKSSKGIWGKSLAAGSYTGQIGAYNVGSRGDVRTNNDTINGVVGRINISNGNVTGNGYSTLELPANATSSTDPIWIDPSKVLYTTSPAVAFDATHKYYGEPKLSFPDIPDIPKPTGNNYSYSSNGNATLPSGNYKDISVSKGQLSIPAGTYGKLNMTSSGSVVLGVPGQTTTYNFQEFSMGSQATLKFNGPVVINVQSSLVIGGQGGIPDLSIPASQIHWNFKGGSNEVVKIGGGGNTLGVFYAPNNALEIQGNGPFYGAIASKSVDLNGTGAVHVDEDAILPVTTTIQVAVKAITTVTYTGSSYSLWRIMQQID
ncbi:MAG TPA: PilX N-terminal domain-containing pilus assembly protein [Blastocatellia bacterium]|nr:PilX N-terminal domain-containing pilus assembly protein [Blastocatellia bacterium]